MNDPLNQGTLRAMIEGSGGIVNASDIARKLNVSRQRVSEWRKWESFPQPLCHLADRPDQPLWLWEAVSRWRDSYESYRETAGSLKGHAPQRASDFAL